MELGNYISVAKEVVTERPDIVFTTCLRDCLYVCKRYGIDPIGSLEMKTFDSWEDPRVAVIMYRFTEGA